MQDIIQNIRKALSEIYPDSEASSLTRLIIEHTTGSSLPIFLSDKSKKITSSQKLIIDKIVARLSKHEPIQYIIGECEFFGLPFVVDKNVLIPRPETEELVELIINENKTDNLRILDIGTGSGAIAIALKKHLRNSYLEAWDFSDEVFSVSKNNAEKNNTDITFRKVNILEEYPTNHKFDIIVSNPPYILESEKEDMNQNVLDFEPHSALFVPDSAPLLFYERIADIAKELLTSNGKLYFEINQAKGKETVMMLEGKGFSDTMLIKDLSKNDRIVTAIL